MTKIFLFLAVVFLQVNVSATPTKLNSLRQRTSRSKGFSTVPVISPSGTEMKNGAEALPGMKVKTIPANCAPKNVDGIQYFHCGATWYIQQQKDNSFIYEVIEAPRGQQL